MGRMVGYHIIMFIFFNISKLNFIIIKVGRTGKVIGIDIIPQLVEWSKQNLDKDDPDLRKSGVVNVIVGNGWKGAPEEGPFDCIHVGAAAATLPEVRTIYIVFNDMIPIWMRIYD
jgi:hypothetical protein